MTGAMDALWAPQWLVPQPEPDFLKRVLGHPGDGDGPRMPVLLALVLLAAAMLLPARVHAQAEPAGIGPGSYVAVGVSASGFNSGYGQQRLAGPTVYVDANLYRRVGVEAEARILRFHAQEDLRQTTYLAGFVSVRTGGTCGRTRSCWPAWGRCGTHFTMRMGGTWWWLRERGWTGGCGGRGCRCGCWKWNTSTGRGLHLDRCGRGGCRAGLACGFGRWLQQS